MTAPHTFSTWPELRQIAPEMFIWNGSQDNVKKEVNKVKIEGLVDKLQEREVGDDVRMGAGHVFACAGSTAGSEYKITLNFGATEVRKIVSCTCPSANKQGLCKHGMAALLRILPPAERAAAFGGGTPTGHRLSGGPQSPATEAAPSPPPRPPVPARNFEQENTHFGPRRLPAFMLTPLHLQEPEGAKKKAAVKKEAAASKPAAATKKPKKEAAAPAQPPHPLPKVYISGDAMMQATDEELLAECHALLGTAPAAPAAHGASATAASPSAQPSREWWGGSPEAMQVEEDGAEEPVAPAAPAPPAPAAPAAAPPPAAPEPAPDAPPKKHVSKFAALFDLD